MSKKKGSPLGALDFGGACSLVRTLSVPNSRWTFQKLGNSANKMGHYLKSRAKREINEIIRLQNHSSNN